MGAFSSGWPVGLGAGLRAAPGKLLLCLWECGSSCSEGVSAFVLLRGVYLCGSCLLSWVRLYLRCYQQMQEQPAPEPGCIGTSRPPGRGRQHFHISPTLMDTQQAGDGVRCAVPCGCCYAFTTLPEPLPCTLAVWDAGSREGGGSRAGRALPALTSRWVLHHKHRGQIPSGSTDSPFSAGLSCPSAPSPPQQLRPDPASCLHKPKPLAFPVQTFPINKWRHHATSLQVTQRRVQGRDGHDHPAPDPLAGRQPCLCLNSRVSKRLPDAS